LKKEINYNILNSKKYPVHRIAEKLLPFLKVLVNEFEVQNILVFGSYAAGMPKECSDVDLLIVKKIKKSRLHDKIAIRRAWWPLLQAGNKLSFDILLADPSEAESYAKEKETFHSNILNNGISLLC